MALELYMVGLIAGDMGKSVDFYRRLGVGFSEAKEGQAHIETKMSGGLTFFLNARGRMPELDDARVILEFYLKDRSAIDAKYKELIDHGYESYHAPYISSIGMYFALINDPDGNTVLLSAD
jgi:predicted lactoylglutathione lyase